MAEKSAYAILGLQKGATEQDIKNAYVQLVKKYDPEKHTDRFMVIQNAYNRLKEPKKRAQEDIHTYNVIRGDFLFLDDERPEGGHGPSDHEIERAQEAYKSSSGSKPARDTYIKMLMRRSNASVRKKLWSEAIKDWVDILDIDPSHVRSRNNLTFAYITLGLSYALHGLHDEAIDLWEKALKLNPDSADLIHNLALASEKCGDGKKAAKYWGETVQRWKSALNSGEGNEEYLKECIIEAHRYHGGQFDANDTPEAKSSAINRYREVLKLRPDDFDAQFQIAAGLMSEQKWPEAIEELDKIHRKHPKNIEVLNMLGSAHLSSGQVDSAFNMWNRSLSIDPKNSATREIIVRAHLTLGKQYRQKGLFTPALVHLKKLLRYLPGSAEVFLEIGATYDMKGDTRSAQQAYQQVMQIDPKNKIARKALNDLRMKR
ncbi:tetratricopeptide repeat protein [bacterium]|nr:tetratricopeptide repeat protein [bacterium]